ncbi:heme biosynthesis HemY N-terminal domain-containing protein [Thiomicrorhabdus sp. zzn3]|uniref:heme biosynthesis HemY N-terminal domain-containing protein n=1 Tax=Thiomicrorhabdus sp. zzn3 TaxID=3039775 RepID=UPI00243730FC|nr:heme biosynthesis HemY N-terminal domain-containing protein [Thiomicrorhabdus sp. zzn3]MDG6778860.1 heme biosynthesis HemY N-terminal domain-containing protein [Thiomicrorhabdus sp. zzn3]
MKQVIIWALVFGLSTALATLALYDSGRLSMVWGDWIIETSLSFALAGGVLGFLLVYLLMRLLITLWQLPKRLKHRKRLKRYSKAENAMAKGMIALEYGDWHRAEKQLIKSAKHSEAGLVHYLSAAKMADNQQAYERRDQYLAQARAEYPEDYVTIGLVEARLLGDQKPDVALTILETLHQQHPKQTTVLAEYARLLQRLKLWDKLETLLPKLKRSSAIDREHFAELEVQLWAGKLASVSREEELDALWQQLDNRQKLNPDILSEYIEQRLGWQQEVGLADWIEKSLKRQWNDRLVYQYGRLTLGPAFERLKKAEPWVKKQPENPVLLLTLGRLACRSQMWGLGQSYLKKSLSLRPEIETFHALAQCYEAEGEERQAALTYKEAILQLEKKQS